MNTTLTALLARNTGTMPVYMGAAHAEQVAERILSADPTALQSPRRLNAFMRLTDAVFRPRVMDQEIEGDGEPGSLTRPSAYAPMWMGDMDDELGYGVGLKNGIATINIDDAIPAHGHWYCGEWIHGYDSIDLAVREALADDRVRGIFLRMDSPGGVVHDGLNVLSRTLNAATKPVWVHADMACSAAYWIAAQCDRIIAPSTGIVGSIGACIIHVEMSGAMAKNGWTVTAIESGPRKTDGASFKPLADEALSHLQSIVDDAAEAFIEAVAGGPRQMDAQKLRDLNAQWFVAGHRDPARAGLALGLCDEIMSEADAFAALVDHASAAGSAAPSPGATAVAPAPKPESKGDPMFRKPKATASTPRTRAAIQAQIEALNAEMDEVEGNDEEEEEEPVPPEGQGEEEEPAAEGNEEEPATEGEDDEDVVARAAMFAGLPEAKGLERFASSLARQPGLAKLSASGQLREVRSQLKAARRDLGLAARTDHAVPHGGGKGQTGTASADTRLVAAAAALASKKRPNRA